MSKQSINKQIEINNYINNKINKQRLNNEEEDILDILIKKFKPYLPSYNIPSLQLPEQFKPIYNIIENFFECSKVGSTIEIEIFSGIINFFSCLYCLPVIPQQLHEAGYHVEGSFATICLVVGLGSIASGLLTNTPLIIAPPTAISIFLASSLRSQNLLPLDGNLAVAMSGIAMFFLGIFGPIISFITLLIPECIQASTTVGIGLLTALAGATEIHLVVRGKYTLLEIGDITNEVIISMAGLVVLGMAIIHHSKLAYVISLGFGTIVWWSFIEEWPTKWTAVPEFHSDTLESGNSNTQILTFSLIFLNILTLFGLARALCDLAHITPSDGSIPRGRLLILVIGLCNIVSGLLYGPPIIISPETAGGIKAGAKTGLSAIVCGILFLLSIFWGPVFSRIPAVATSPLLIIIGLILFMNISRIDFKVSKYGIPSFCCLFFIPFTNSIICGLSIGYVMYIILNLFTLDLYYEIKKRYYLLVLDFDEFFERESFGGERDSFQRTFSTENVLLKDQLKQQNNNNNNNNNQNNNNSNKDNDKERLGKFTIIIIITITI